MLNTPEQEQSLRLEIFGDFESLIRDARTQLADAVVCTQLGLTRKSERLAAEAAIGSYADLLCQASYIHLGKIYETIEYDTQPDDETFIRNEHFINRGVDLATDAVEGDVRILHDDITRLRADRSRLHVVFERGRATRLAPFLGRVAVNGPGAAAAWAGNEVLNGQVDNKFLVGSILVAVFAGVRFGAPIVLKSAAQAVLGKRVEKVLQPVSPGIRAKLKHTDIVRERHGQPKLTLNERVRKIREFETEHKVDDLHDEFGSDVRDWLLASTKSDIPTREQAIAIIRQGITEHLFETYGFTHQHNTLDEEEIRSMLPKNTQ
jgi:hypothetical protein